MSTKVALAVVVAGVAFAGPLQADSVGWRGVAGGVSDAPADAVLLAANCPNGNTDPNCPNNIEAQRRAQQEAQRALEAQRREQAQERAREEAQQREAQRRAQEQEQQRALQEAKQTQEAQRRAQEQAQERAQQAAKQTQEAQRRTQEQAQERAQQAAKQTQESQRRAQQDSQRRAQQESQQHTQEAQRHTQEEVRRAAQQESQQKVSDAQRRTQQEAQRRAQQESQQRAQESQQRARDAKSRTQEVQQANREATSGKRAESQRNLQQQREQQTQAIRSREQLQTPQRGTAAAESPDPKGSRQEKIAGQERKSLSAETNASDAQGAQPHRQGPSAVSRPPGPLAQPRTVSLNRSTTVSVADGGRNLTMDHARADGAHVVVTRWAQTGTPGRVSAYKSVEAPNSGAVARLHLDGHKVIVGRDFTKLTTPARVTFTTHKNGLRDASLPNGKPIFRETFATIRMRDGRTTKIVRRELFVVNAFRTPTYLRAPLVQVYEAAPVYGLPVYVYRPKFMEPAFYDAFWRPFVTALAVTPACNVCPSPVASFAEPVVAYSDPMDLLSDLQIADPIDEGIADDVDSNAGPSADTAELEDLRGQAEALEQQVTDSSVGNAEFRSMITDQQQQMDGLQAQLDAIKAGPMPSPARGKAPIAISDALRQELRRQVRMGVAQLANDHPVSLAEIIGSPYAVIYVFQAAAPIDVAEVGTGARCILGIGDITGFYSIPGPGSAVAQMSIKTSGIGSCRPTAVVEIPLVDLQEMLNATSQRLESNIKKVRNCLGSPATCRRA